MHKVISIEEPKNYTDYQLKLIAYNIIDYVCTIENVFIDDILFNYAHGFRCHYYATKKGVINDIVITLDRNILNITAPSYGISTFIKSYNILDNSEYIAGFTFLILHELGHAVFSKKIFDKIKYKGFDKYHAFEAVIKNSIRMMFPIRKEHRDDDEEFNYCFDPTEQIANQYAYLHFKEIWDMLIYRRLII